MPSRASQRTVPTSAGPDEETVRLTARDFRRHHRKVARSGRRRVVRRVLALVLLVALVAAGVWAVYFSPYLTAERVQVSGNALVGSARIERTAAVPTGTPLARLDLDAIRKRVETIPAVRRAEVSRQWPHGVRVDVTERTAVAVVDQGSGLESLDASGVAFGSPGGQADGLPLVKVKDGAGHDAVAEGARVVAALPDRIAPRVQSIDVETIDKITLHLRGGRTVVWGSAEDSAAKGEVLEALLRRPGQTIDVSVPARPTTR